MTLMINVGHWGGFYLFRGYSWRICLGWLAITVFPCDLDEVWRKVNTVMEWRERTGQ